MANLRKLITPGALKALASTGQQQLQSSPFAQPVVQLLSHRKVSGGGPTRYRLTVTDGEQCSVAMLGMGLNHMVEEDQLPSGTVLRITSYVPAGKITFIIISLDVLGVCARIGPDTEQGASAAQLTLPHQSQQLAQVQPLPFLPVSASATSAGNGAGSSSGRRGLDASRVRPIAALNPYQTCWTICGRVTQKTQMRNWTNRRGQGHFFSFALSDDTGSIRVAAFEAEADRFFDTVEIGRPLYVSRARVKAANRQFGTADSAEYEMLLTSESRVQPCDEASCPAVSVPELKFNFVPISQLASVEPNSLVDVCGVAHETHECQTIRGRASGRQVTKRDLLLVDTTGWAVRCTLWGQEAADFGSRQQHQQQQQGAGATAVNMPPVLAIRSARVSDFGGRSLSLTPGSCLLVEPARLPEADRLRAWYRQQARGGGCSFACYGRELGGGGGSGSSSGAPYRDLSSCSSLLGLGTGRAAASHQQVVFRCLAVPDCIRKETCLYRACPKSDCNKKVTEYNEQYWCEKCQAMYPNFEWRYMLSVDLADFSGNRWATCFQDTAEKLLGVSADHLGRLRAAESDDNGSSGRRIDELLSRALYRLYLFTLRVRMEPFQDELRQRIVVQDVEPLGDYAQASRQLIGQIEAATAKWQQLRAEI